MPGVLNKLLHRKRGTVSELWRFDAKAPLLSPPLVADIDEDGKEEILVATTAGFLICMDMQRRERWRLNVKKRGDPTEEFFLDEETAHSINTTPQCSDIDNDGKFEILIGTENGRIMALTTNGKVRWTFSCGEIGRAHV